MASSKLEYLKRYMSEDTTGDGESKKKKRRKKVKTGGMRIVDEDVRATPIAEDDQDDVGEEPTVEVPEELEAAMPVAPSKWKSALGTGKVGAGNGSGSRGRLTKPKRRYDSDSDQSPPRRRKRRASDSDNSPPRRRARHDSDSDNSPPRRRTRHDSDSDISPPRRRARHDSDSDISPPRRRARHNSDSDNSPLRRRMRHDSDSDNSPSRRRARHVSDSDNSPPRRRMRHDSDSDNSPSQRRARHDSDSDNSPPRRRARHDSDDDIPQSHSHARCSRKDNGADDALSKRPQAKPLAKDSVRVSSMAKKAGLQTGRDLREEMDTKWKMDKEAFKSLDSDQTGQNSTTVFRDKSGRKLNLVEERKRKREAEEKKAAEMEKYMEWGKGIVQKREAEEKVDEMLHEMSKPLARSRDDADLDRMLRDQDREGDPMAMLLSKKKASSVVPEKPVWKGPFPPNRFNIRPGYRWDGVDRSNGFEKKLFASRADRQATAEIAYQWSVEDM